MTFHFGYHYLLTFHSTFISVLMLNAACEQNVFLFSGDDFIWWIVDVIIVLLLRCFLLLHDLCIGLDHANVVATVIVLCLCFWTCHIHSEGCSWSWTGWQTAAYLQRRWLMCVLLLKTEKLTAMFSLTPDFFFNQLPDDTTLCRHRYVNIKKEPSGLSENLGIKPNQPSMFSDINVQIIHGVWVSEE